MPYYNRRGEQIDMLTWGKLFEDMAYKRVAENSIGEGIWVSTVWIGLDHRFIDEGPPLIFETMVFVSADPGEDRVPMEGTETYRYASETEAIAHHDQLVAELRGVFEV